MKFNAYQAIALALGLYLATAKRKAKTPQQAARLASHKAATLSRRPAGAALSLPAQRDALRFVLRRAPQAVRGVFPFDLTKNHPTNAQIAALYSIDPTLEIFDDGISAPVSALYELAILEDPNLSVIAKATLQDRIDNVLAILPDDRLVAFSIELAERASPLMKAAGVESDYAVWLAYLKRKAVIRNAKKPKAELVRILRVVQVYDSNLADFLDCIEVVVNQKFSPNSYVTPRQQLRHSLKARAVTKHNEAKEQFKAELHEERRKAVNAHDVDADWSDPASYTEPPVEYHQMNRRAEKAFDQEVTEILEPILRDRLKKKP